MTFMLGSHFSHIVFVGHLNWCKCIMANNVSMSSYVSRISYPRQHEVWKLQKSSSGMLDASSDVVNLVGEEP